MPVLVKASLFLFVAAEAFILLALGPSALPLVAAWALAGVVVATVVSSRHHGHAVHVGR